MIGDKIYQMHQKEYKSRPGLGLSQAGHPCPAWLWYCYHDTPTTTPDGRILDIFKLGDLVEEKIIHDLRKCGYTVLDQQRLVTLKQGAIVLRGHIDGIIEGPDLPGPCLLEIKSSNKARFSQLNKLGYEAWDEKYKYQIHAYATLLRLDNILTIVYCKDSSEYYSELLSTDPEYFYDKSVKVFDAIKQKSPAERLCPRQDWWLAKMCDYSSTCWSSS